MVVVEYPVHPNTPTMIKWTIGGSVNWKSSARKVTHLSTILAFSGLINPGDPNGIQVKRPWL